MVSVTAPEALGWKHNNEPGIETRDGELTAWPDSLGSFPTQAQVNQWEAEYAAFIADKANQQTEIEDIIEALVAKSLLTATDIETAKRMRPRIR